MLHFESKFLTDNQFFVPKDFGKYFSVSPAFEQVFRGMQAITRKDIFTDSNFDVHQSVRTFITKKDLEKEKKEHFRKFQTMLLEMGHPTHFRRDFPDAFGMELMPRGDQEAPKIYWGLQEYIIDNTRVQGLTFNQLDLLARLYFGLANTILLANLSHYLTTRLSRRICCKRSQSCLEKMFCSTVNGPSELRKWLRRKIRDLIHQVSSKLAAFRDVALNQYVNSKGL